MSRGYISPEVRQRVAEHSRFRCGYCQTPQLIVGPFLELDHIIPESKGGTSDEENLILACPMCNSHKADRIAGRDAESGEIVPLFNPRKDVWAEHFEWDEGGVTIIGKTPVGRVTILMLNMNHSDTVAARQLWVSAGWHPPKN